MTAVASPAVQRVPPPPEVSSGVSWRDAAYALQWWVFALFAGYMWWRMVRDDYEHGHDDHSSPKPQTMTLTTR